MKRLLAVFVLCILLPAAMFLAPWPRPDLSWLVRQTPACLGPLCVDVYPNEVQVSLSWPAPDAGSPLLSPTVWGSGSSLGG